MNLFSKAWPFLALVGMFSSLAFAEQKSEPRLELSFEDAIRLALQREIGALVAGERVFQAVQRWHEAQAPFYPQITAQASQSRQTRNLEAQGIRLPNQDPLVGPFNTFDARVKLTQTIFDAGVMARLSSARSGRALSEAQARAAKEDAMALGGTLYVEAKRASDAVQVAQTVLDRDEKKLSLAQTQLHWGSGTLSQVLDAQADAAESRHRLESAKREFNDRRLDLAVALGLTRSREITFASVSFPDAVQAPQDKEIEEALLQAPDMLSAKAALEQSRQEKTVAQANYFPKATASADYGSSGVTLSDAETTYSVGAQVSLPIFEGSRTRSRVKLFRSAIAESQARYDNTLRQQEAEAFNARDTMEETRVLLEAKAAEEAAAQKQLQIAQRRLRNGSASELDVIEATTQVALAQDRKEEAQALYLMARVKLARLLGQMDQFFKGGDN